MSLVRQPLLKPEVEDKLKNELSKHWLAGMKGKDIAQELTFGVKGSPYEKLKPCYVYYYRQKFAKDEPELFPLRQAPSFAKNTLSANRNLRRTRYKVQPDEIGLIEPEEFIELLNEKLPHDSFYCRRARSYLIVHFWTPLRSSEIYERVIQDFKITKDKITISLFRKKKKHMFGDKKEPIDIRRNFPLVDELVEWLEGEEWKHEKNPENRPWNISHDTARNYVKELGEDIYPHYFRFRYLTEQVNYPDTSIGDLKSKTHLTLSALERYVFASKQVERRLDDRITERLRKKGLIK